MIRTRTEHQAPYDSSTNWNNLMGSGRSVAARPGGVPQGGGGSQFGMQTGMGNFYDTSGRLRSSGLHGWIESPDFKLAQQKEQFRQTAIGNLWGSLLGGGFATAGGASGPSPEISVGGVYTPQQVDRQVNAARASNDATTASRSQSVNRDMAGRGFAPSSPLAMALRGQLQNQNMAQNATADREIRHQAAGANAQHLLGTQQARESQFASRMDEDIRRRQPYFSMLSQMMSLI